MKPNTKQRGFALIMAIGALPVVVVAIESVASLVAADIRQTHAQIEQAQVEQLLLAACLTATRGEKLVLPPALLAAGAQVHVDDKQVSASLGHIRQTYSLSSTSTSP